MEGRPEPLQEKRKMKKYERYEGGLEGYNSDREGSGCLWIVGLAIIASIVLYCTQ